MASEINQEQFDQKLEELCERLGGKRLLALPGVYEVLSEELNNDVLREIEAENDDSACIKLRLTATFLIQPAGVPIKELVTNLYDVVSGGMSRGTITYDTPAEVVEWNSHVEVIE